MTGINPLLLVGLCFSLLQQTICVTVTTSKGVVNGFRPDYGSDTTQLYYGSADVFLGIPYAEPPVGSLRFQPPVSKAAWNSQLNATSFSSYAQCPQPLSGLNNGIQNKSSEDCLYLNVFSPNVSSSSKYPVMVWIHGGSFLNGNAAQYGLKGTVRNLISRGVVVVTIHYRLGLLGFFTTSTSDFPANLGMLDQVLALQWVKQEISAFGGDASQVTIFGESAGGASVSAHTYSPLSKGLFQKAIMQSGVTLLCMDGTFGYNNLSQRRAMQLCNFTSDQWASGNYSPLKECLQNMPFQRFIDLEADNPFGWQMVKDKNFLPGFPQDLAASRSNIPILIGTNRDEWAFFQLVALLSGAATLNSYTKQYYQGQIESLTQFYGQNQTVIKLLIDKVYVDQTLSSPDQENDNLSWFKLISRIGTDANFISLTAREVDWWRNINKNPNIYLYEFVYPTNTFRLDYNITWRPTYHALDTFYLWMQEALWEPNPLVSDDDRTVANNFGQIWTDFAKNGIVTWDPVTLSKPYQYMEINITTTMKQEYGKTARLFWNGMVPVLVGVYPREPQNGLTTNTLSTTNSGRSDVINSAVSAFIAIIRAFLDARDN